MMNGYEYKFLGLSDTEIEERLFAYVIDALHDKYGNNPDRQVIKRIDEEWETIKQISLIKKLFNAKLGSNDDSLILNDDEIKLLYGDVDECLVSLGELNIFRA